MILFRPGKTCKLLVEVSVILGTIWNNFLCSHWPRTTSELVEIRRDFVVTLC